MIAAPTTTPDVDWDILIDHEYEPPCGITKTMRTAPEPCDLPAEWWAQFRPHCTPERGPWERLLCVAHYRYIVDGGTATCTVCGAFILFRDYVLRFERIKP